MPTLKETAQIRTDAATLWHFAGGFGAVGDWHPMLAQVAAQGDTPGSLRTAIGKDGSKQVEQLEAIDPGGHWYRYTMANSPMPVSDYKAEFRIVPMGDDTSVVTWSARFQVAGGDGSRTVESVRQFLRAGLDSLASRFA